MIIEKETFYRRALLTAFWIRGCWGFFASDFVPIMAQLESFVFLMCDAVIVALGVVLMRKKTDWLYAIAFLAITYVITCEYNHLSFKFYINGLRDFMPYMFVIPIFRYFLSDDKRRERFVAIMDKHLFVYLVVQAPCCVIQYIMNSYDPDLIGGSLGHWYSGVTTTIIFAISFYLIRKRIDTEHFWISLWQNKIYIILLLPTQLNETKVGFVLFFLYLLLLMPINRKMFVRMIAFIPIIVALMAGMYMAYALVNGLTLSEMFSDESALDMYMFDASGDSAALAEYISDNDMGEIEDVPRFAKLALLPEVNDTNPGHNITGFGIGHFKGGTVMDSSALAIEYDWLFFGSIPYFFHLYIQLGIIGVALMLLFLWNLFSAPKPRMKRDYNIHLYFLANFLIIQLYNDSIRTLLMMLVLSYIIMVSWSKKEDVKEPEDDKSLEMNKYFNN